MNKSIKVIAATAISAAALVGTGAAANATMAYDPHASMTAASCAADGSTVAVLRLDNRDSRNRVSYYNGFAKDGKAPSYGNTVVNALALYKMRVGTTQGHKLTVTSDWADTRFVNRTIVGKACPIAQLGDVVEGQADVRISNPSNSDITMTVRRNNGAGWIPSTVVAAHNSPTTVQVPVSVNGTAIQVITPAGVKLLNTTAHR